MNSEIANIKVLQKALSAGLLNDIEDLLDKQAKKDRLFNILRVFGIEELEIRHSFMLKWLLSPKEDHGLGDLFLKLFLKCYVNETEGGNAKKFSERYRALKAVADYNSFVADREVEHIDLLLVSEKEKIVIAIENKWNACERVDTEGKEGQLSEYEKLVSGRFPDHKWNRYFIFLTPDKRSPSKKNVDTWDVLGYDSVAKILDYILGNLKIAPLGQEQRLLIQHYYEIVERKLAMEGAKIKDLCNQIYDQYWKELEFLFKNANRGERMLRSLRNGIQIKDGELLPAVKGDSLSYVQYKRRLPEKESKSVHYEISIGEKECTVLLHIEKNTHADIIEDLLEAVSSKCKEVGIERIQKRHSKNILILGGAKIVILRQNKSDEAIENEIRTEMARMYESFEPILQGFEARIK